MSILIALDCGHGLNTAGKQTPDGIKEWSLNDKVRDKVVALLSDYDVEFVFPDNNEGVTDENLTSRRTMYVNKGVAAAVSIHHNANTGSWNSATGVEVYTDKNATAKDKELAKAIYERLVTNTGLRGRGVKEANWTVINQNAIPAVLVEGGFMDSKNDYKVITSDAGQEAYARAIADGLITFLGLKKKVVAPPAPAPAPKPTPAPAKPKVNQKVLEWQKAAIADGFTFPKYGADGQWGLECEQVAGKAIVKKRTAGYKYTNLTRIVQKAVGCAADGKCGSNTKAAIIAYQKNHGLTADGAVGPATWKKILGV